MSTDLHELRAADASLDAFCARVQQAAAAQAAKAELEGELPPRVCVTGSSGYVGATLVRALRLRGISTVGVDLLAAETTDVVASVADVDAMRRAMVGCKGVFNTAALHAPHDKGHTEEEFHTVNVVGTEVVLAAAQEAGADVVHSSTTSLLITAEAKAAMSRDEVVWLDESDGKEPPRNKYGRTKQKAEALCEAAAAQNNVMVLRISRCFPEDMLEATSVSLANGKANELLGRRVSLVDVVDAHLRAMARASQIKFGVFMLCAPWPFSKEETPKSGTALAQLVKERFPEAITEYAKHDWKLPETITRVYDSSKAQEVLGWKPRWSFPALLTSMRASSEEALQGLL